MEKELRKAYTYLVPLTYRLHFVVKVFTVQYLSRCLFAAVSVDLTVWVLLLS